MNQLPQPKQKGSKERLSAPVADVNGLLRRVRRLLSHQYAGRSLAPVIDELQRHGPVALFGGAVRDLARSPAVAFRSDLDLVIRGKAVDINRALTELGGQRNRFGGYRLRVVDWTIDAWALQSTWAFRSGYIEGRTFADLTRTTFFNWDAVVYDMSHDVLYADDDYLQILGARSLEIALEPNPNPLGNIARALRLAATGRAQLGPQLSSYIVRHISLLTNGANSRDDSSGRWRNQHVLAGKYFTFFQVDAVRQVIALLQRHVEQKCPEPFSMPTTQLRLNLP